MVYLRTKDTTKKQQEDATSNDVAAADSVNADLSKMEVGYTRIQ